MHGDPTVSLMAAVERRRGRATTGACPGMRPRATSSRATYRAQPITWTARTRRANRAYCGCDLWKLLGFGKRRLPVWKTTGTRRVAINDSPGLKAGAKRVEAARRGNFSTASRNAFASGYRTGECRRPPGPLPPRQTPTLARLAEAQAIGRRGAGAP